MPRACASEARRLERLKKKKLRPQTPCTYLCCTTSTTIEPYSVRSLPIPRDYIDNNNYYCCCCRPCRPDVTANDRLFPQVHPFGRIVHARAVFMNVFAAVAASPHPSPVLLVSTSFHYQLFRYTCTVFGTSLSTPLCVSPLFTATPSSPPFYLLLPNSGAR